VAKKTSIAGKPQEQAGMEWGSCRCGRWFKEDQQLCWEEEMKAKSLDPSSQQEFFSGFRMSPYSTNLAVWDVFHSIHSITNKLNQFEGE
jgi:hypothetical protein